MLKDKWEEWIENAEVEYTKRGNQKCASYTLVAGWANEIRKFVVTKDLIVTGFCQCGYIDYEVDISVLHSHLCQMIEKRQVPEEVIQEVNELFEETLSLNEEEDNEDKQEIPLNHRNPLTIHLMVQNVMKRISKLKVEIKT